MYSIDIYQDGFRAGYDAAKLVAETGCTVRESISDPPMALDLAPAGEAEWWAAASDGKEAFETGQSLIVRFEAEREVKS